MTGARWVAVIGLGAVIVALAVAMLRQEPRLSGTDLTPNEAFILRLSEGQEVCQSQELLPADTAALAATIGTYGKPGPALRLTVTGPHGTLLTEGSLAEGWRQGDVRIPVRRVTGTTNGARVCLREGGHMKGARAIAIAGQRPDPGFTMQVDGHDVEGARLRYEYFRPGRESWYQLLPAIVHRFSLGKAGFVRHWEWWAALVLLIATAGLAIATAIRYVAPPRRAP